jgi:hypothetical protein
VEADNEAEAGRKARAVGLLVSTLSKGQEESRETPPPAPIPLVPEYASAQTVQQPASRSPGPDYTALTLAATVMVMLGAILCAGGPLLAILAAMQGDSPDKATAMESFVAGVCLVGVGEGLKALRDIARNSFRA